MKILFATDGSPCSEAACEEICKRPWPAQSEVQVLSVIHAHIPTIPDPFLVLVAAHQAQLAEARTKLPKAVDAIAARIRARRRDLEVTVNVLEGAPKQVIVDEAERWGADLIVLGCHGYGPVKRFVLGSVSHAVALHAHCSVEIVRCAHAGADG